MVSYIINKETEGDGWYHVHVFGSKCAPAYNFSYLTSKDIYSAVEEAKKLLNVSNVKRCPICT